MAEGEIARDDAGEARMGEEGAVFDSADWAARLLALNPWIEENGLRVPEPEDWDEDRGHSSGETFLAARKAACWARYQAGKDAWNRWAEAMTALRDELDAAGLWKVKPRIRHLAGKYIYLLSGECGEAAAFIALSEGDFHEAVFETAAEFGDIVFPSSARFEGAVFRGQAGFQRATFGGRAGFQDATFGNEAGGGEASFAQVQFKGATAYDRAVFKASVSFEAAQGQEGSSFSLADTVFHKVPNFIQAHFQIAPRLDHVHVVPSERGRDVAARWRALKGLAIAAHDHERERDFFAGEILSQRWAVDKPAPWFWKDQNGERRLSWPKGARFWFGLLYQITSNFGRSTLQPTLC